MSTQIAKIKAPEKDVDLELLVFVERYATNYLKWDILTYFGQYPDDRQTAEDIAGKIGRNYKALRPEIGDLAMLGVLKKSNNSSRPKYQLTSNPLLRTQALKFAYQNTMAVNKRR